MSSFPLAKHPLSTSTLAPPTSPTRLHGEGDSMRRGWEQLAQTLEDGQTTTPEEAFSSSSRRQFGGLGFNPTPRAQVRSSRFNRYVGTPELRSVNLRGSVFPRAATYAARHETADEATSRHKLNDHFRTGRNIFFSGQEQLGDDHILSSKEMRDAWGLFQCGWYEILNEGKWTSGLAYIEQAYDKVDALTLQAFEFARELHFKGRVDDSYRLFEHAYLRHENCREADLFQAEFLKRNGRLDEAEHLLVSLEQLPFQADLTMPGSLMLSEFQFKKTNYTEAAQSLEKVLAWCRKSAALGEPKHGELLGRRYNELHLRKVLYHNLDLTAYVGHLLARSWSALGRNKQADALCVRLIGECPRDAELSVALRKHLVGGELVQSLESLGPKGPGFPAHSVR